MNEMIERVARAIVTADEQNGGPPWDALVVMGKHVMDPVYDRARAAIEAMREPTDTMVEAGYSSEWQVYSRCDPPDLAPAAPWRAMIDEALKP